MNLHKSGLVLGKSVGPLIDTLAGILINIKKRNFILNKLKNSFWQILENNITNTCVIFYKISLSRWPLRAYKYRHVWPNKLRTTLGAAGRLFIYEGCDPNSQKHQPSRKAPPENAPPSRLRCAMCILAWTRCTLWP